MRAPLVGIGGLVILGFVLFAIPGRGMGPSPAARPEASAGDPDVGFGPFQTFVRVVEGRWRVFVFHPEAGVEDVTDGFPEPWPVRTPQQRRAAVERWRGLRPPRWDEKPPPDFARRWHFPIPLLGEVPPVEDAP